MKFLFSFFVMVGLVCSQLAIAQVPQGFKAMLAMQQLQQTLAKNAQQTQTISSSFKQTKHMKMMNEKMQSKGLFYYKQTDKIRIEYTHPFTYLLVMNAGQIMVKDENKSNKINTKNSKTMQSVNKVMMDCMRGTVFANKDFSVKAFDSKSQYLMQLTPVNASMKNLFSRVDVYIDKANNGVTKLLMTETGGDYTEMNFSNIVFNSNLSDALFSVR
jgi:outer membrane lipoprotein-sorting protein